MLDKNDIQASLLDLESQINNASSTFDDWIDTGDDNIDPSWQIEICFIQILAIAETLGQMSIHQLLMKEYSMITSSKDRFNASSETPDGDCYSSVLSRIRKYKTALQGYFSDIQSTMISRDVLQILRNIHYSITDRDVFVNPPKNENEVHLRIENILKCFFPDLKHKPSLTKAIKNFEPDTGISSIKTLIEYKFLSRREEASSIADQILADTRGYVSGVWKRFIYVIYETNRFKTETEWNQLLKDSGVPQNTCVVVLSGVPHNAANRKKPRGTKI
jgi:hypothetical protein